MPEATLDERGRLSLPKPLRERIAERYRVVELHDDVKPVPVPCDPLEARQSTFEVAEGSAANLRKAAREGALENAGR